MSWTWSLPILLPREYAGQYPPMEPEHTRVVIATFRDWDAARLTVESILECRHRPCELVLVDDNAELNPPRWVSRSPIRYLSYRGNRGPSFARNFGAAHDSGRDINWFYFTDSGCDRDVDFFDSLMDVQRLAPRSTVAVGGPVLGSRYLCETNPINRYMTEERILCPPCNEEGSQAIVTANALVSAEAFRVLQGFDCSYPFAAAEDLDLGVRLRRFGRIAWAERAAVYHEFRESLDDLAARFVRYGAGTAHLEKRLGLASLRPTHISAADPALQYLADTQLAAMRKGYDQQTEVLRTLESSRHSSQRTSVTVPRCQSRRRIA